MDAENESLALAHYAPMLEKAAWPILAVSALITVLLLIQLVPNPPEFHTQLADFAPENEATKAEKRLSEHFPSESRPIFVHVTSDVDGENILSLENLRTQNQHLELIQDWGERNQGFIVANISAPGMVQLALDEEANGTLLAEVSDWQEILDSVLDDDVDCTDDKNSQLDALASFAQASLLHKEFDAGPTCDYLSGIDVDPTPKSISTLWVIEVNPELSDDERQVKAHLLREEFADFSDDSGLHYSVASLDLVSYDIDQGTFENLVTLIVIAVLVVVLILAVAFRSARGVAFPLAGLSLALIWTYGILNGFGVQFTALEVAIAPLVLGLGIDYSIHLQRRYEAFRSEGMTPAESWILSVDRLAVALSLAVITTVAAFLSNLLSPLPPVRTFGLGLALGVISAFLCCTVVVGCMHVVMDRKERKGEGAKILQLPLLANILAIFQRKHQALVIVIAVLLCGASLFGAARLETEFDLSDFLDEDMEIMDVREELTNSYSASSWKLVYLFIESEGSSGMGDGLDLLDQLVWLDGRLGHVHGVVGWEDGHPSYEGPYAVLRDAVLRDSEWGESHNLEMYGDELAEINASAGLDLSIAFTNLSTNSSVADPLTGRTWSERIANTVHLENGEIQHLRMEIRVSAATSSDSELIINAFEKELGSEDTPGTLRAGLAGLEGGSAQVHMGGDLVKLVAVLHGLTSSQVESTALSLVVSLAVLILLTRRLVPALLVLLPVGVATMWSVGSMVLFGLNWNVLTVMVTALTIGIGIDYTIHVWRRFDTELENHDGNAWEAIRTMLSTTGVALMLSAGTTVCGFLILLFSPMPVVQDFGLVTAITVLFSLVLAILFLPVLLALSEEFSEGNGESEPDS